MTPALDKSTESLSVMINKVGDICKGPLSPLLAAKHFKILYSLRFVHVNFLLQFRPIHVFSRVQIWRQSWSLHHWFGLSLTIFWVDFVVCLAYWQLWKPYIWQNVCILATTTRNIQVLIRIHDAINVHKRPKTTSPKSSMTPSIVYSGVSGPLSCMQSPFVANMLMGYMTKTFDFSLIWQHTMLNEILMMLREIQVLCFVKYSQEWFSCLAMLPDSVVLPQTVWCYPRQCVVTPDTVV